MLQNNSMKLSPRDTSPNEDYHTSESTPRHSKGSPLNIEVPKLKQATPSVASEREVEDTNHLGYRTDGFRVLTPKTPICPCL